MLLIQSALGSQPTFTAATTQREFTLILSEVAVPSLPDGKQSALGKAA